TRTRPLRPVPVAPRGASAADHRGARAARALRRRRNRARAPKPTLATTDARGMEPRRPGAYRSAMRSHRLGPTGIDLPVTGQGTWRMEDDDRKSAVAALQKGIELGMTHIDTAELYGHGRVEQIVAEAIRGRRERVYLVSKVMPSNASARG